MLDGISWLKATVIQLNTMLMMLQTIKHEAHQLLYIDTSLDGILSARISKLMTTDSPIQSGKVTILTLPEYHTRTNDSELAMSSITILSLLMNLLSHQLRDTVCSIRSWQSSLLLQLFSSSVWCDT